MAFQKRDIVNTLWALILPLVLMVAATTLTDIFQNEMTIQHNDLLVRIASAAAVFLSPVAGFVFARRVFPRHAIVVALIYYPVMICLLMGFGLDLVGMVLHGYP